MTDSVTPCMPSLCLSSYCSSLPSDKVGVHSVLCNFSAYRLGFGFVAFVLRLTSCRCCLVGSDQREENDDNRTDAQSYCPCRWRIDMVTVIPILTPSIAFYVITGGASGLLHSFELLMIFWQSYALRFAFCRVVTSNQVIFVFCLSKLRPAKKLANQHEALKLLCAC